jgi:uncharacterized protein (TIGR02453 family)
MSKRLLLSVRSVYRISRLARAGGSPVPSSNALLTPETFRFFRDLAHHNHKDWMDANRERYQVHVVQLFRKLLETLAPAVLALSPRFDTCGRTGVNFSRINRDIRFSKDKTPYRPQMYLMFPGSGDEGWQSGQFYVGVSAGAVTLGFRIYSDYKSKTGALAQIARPRVLKDPSWPRRQKQRLGRRYESYWYSMEKHEWTKHHGWPLAADEWNRLLGWVVRKKLKPSAAMHSAFSHDILKTFQELLPLFRFTSLSGPAAH